MASQPTPRKPAPSSSAQQNSKLSSGPSVESLATLASTIYAGGRDGIDSERAVEVAFDIWSKSKGRLEATVQQQPDQGNEDIARTAGEMIRKITGQAHITRARSKLEKYIKEHANLRGMASGNHPASDDIAAFESLLQLSHQSPRSRDISGDWHPNQVSKLKVRFREWYDGLSRSQRHAGEKKSPGRPRKD